LRRCFFHYIKFPDYDTLKAIVDVHHPDIKTELVRNALEIFFEIRQVNGLKKRPSTSELIDWLKLLVSDELSIEQLQDNDIKQALPPLFGALIKNEQDVHLLERLAFMSRRKEL
jgi:MoxR-like ATPase